MLELTATLDRFTDVVDGVRDWDAPTPVPQWRARDVVRHLVSWVPGFVAQAGFTLLTPDESAAPPQAWREHREAVLQLIASHGEEPMNHPYTPPGLTLAQSLDNFYVADVFMHTWDLAIASGQQPQLDQQTAAGMLNGMIGMEDALRASGQFGTQQPVAADAPAVDQLMAFIGRDPYWSGPRP